MRSLARGLLCINFVLLVALMGPGSSRQLYLELKKLGVEHAITYASQMWFLISTVATGAIFVTIAVSKSESLRAQRPTKLDWGLFLSWMFVVAAVCLFAFMVGLGG
jgi:hypothetical protein